MHTAQITTLTNIQPIAGADFIVSAGVWNGVAEIARVVVKKTETEGNIGVYFAPDLQLSEAFAAANDLIARYEDGKKVGGGYFDQRRRVVAQKFKKVRSDGLWLPIDCLEFAYQNSNDFQFFARAAEIGTLFDTVNDHGKETKICGKYFTPATLDKRNSGKLQMPALDFPKHMDTEQLIHHIGDIPVGAQIYISPKLHGTSHRKGKVEVPQKLTWWQKLVNRVWKKYPEKVYEIVHGTRNVVIHAGKIGFHGSEDFRYAATAGGDLHPDEIVYGEIVGYANGSLIMPEHSTKDIKELKQQFGDTIRYTYQCGENECQFYVYRITQGKEHRDLTYVEMAIRARDLGYKFIPAVSYLEYDGNAEKLLEKVQDIAEPNGMYAVSAYNSKHIEEGVVLRIEYKDTVTFMKYKSFGFKVMEGIVKASDTYTDMEETA